MKKSLKLLSLVLAAIMLLSLAPVSVFADTAEKPADAVTNGGNAIYDAEDFMAITSGNSYYLANDIDFSKETITTPYVKENFWGNIDGRGFALKNITLNITSGSETIDAGIFGLVQGTPAEGGTNGNTVITNLKVQKLKITVDDKAMSAEAVTNINLGGLIGRTAPSHAILVRNVHVNAEITVERTNDKGGHIAVGGIAGNTKQFDITDSSFSGSISVSTEGNVNSTYVGGILGHLDSYGGVAGNYTTFKNCVNNASITMEHTVTDVTKEYGVGGIIGLAKDTAYVMNCVNNGNIISTQSSKIGGLVGVIEPYYNKVTLTLLTDCVNEGYVLANANDKVTTSDIYGSVGVRDQFKDTTPRIFVTNCKNRVDETDDEVLEGALTDSGRNLPIYETEDIPEDSDKYKYIISLTTGAEFEKIGTDASYPEDAFYILGNNIDLGYTESTAKNVVIKSFSGVLYGNGNTIGGLCLSASGNQNAALIEYLSATFDAAILNLKLGSAETPVDITVNNVAGTKNYGRVSALAAIMGHTADYTNTGLSTVSTVVSDVDIYVDLDGDRCQWFGAVAGYTKANHGIYDCNVYGNVSVTGINGETNLATYVANPANHTYANYNGRYAGYEKTVVVGCNDFIDYSAKVTSGNNQIRIGALGWTSSVSCVLLDSSSFGERKVTNADSSTVVLSACGAAAYSHDHGAVSIVNCSNYGMVSGGTYNALGIANVNKIGTSSRYLGMNDYSDSDVDMSGLVASGKTNPTEVCCRDNRAVSVDAPVMKNGASVRIDPNPANAGLRFRATVSEAAIAELKEIYGDKATVSYGIIIAPTLFTKQVTDFTAAKLDEWSNSETMKEAFRGDKAYVDVEASEGYWFKNQPGVIAASVKGLEGLFDAAFSGRAYIKVTVAGVEVYRVYADYSDENNSKVFNGVLESALNDVLYTNDNGKTWYTDEGCKVETTMSEEERATYDVNLSDENAEVKKYTCYTAEQYADLVTLQTNISNLNNQGE